MVAEKATIMRINALLYYEFHDYTDIIFKKAWLENKGTKMIRVYVIYSNNGGK